MNTTDDVTRSLREQADRIGGHPIDLDSVRGRARGIQRRRRAVGAVAVAAVLAVAVPTALRVGGGIAGSQEPIGPANPGPSPTDVVRTTLTLDGLANGDAPGIEYFTADGVVLPGKGLQPLDENFQAMIENPAQGGWSAVGPTGEELVDLTDSFERTSARATTGTVVTTPDRSRIAFVAPESGAQTLVVWDTTDPEGGRSWDIPESPMVSPVGFVADDTVVYQETGQGGRHRLFFADPDGQTRPFGAGDYYRGIDANPATGLVSVQTESKPDGSGCFGVVDSSGNRSTPVWDTCDYSLGTFSPDGRYVLASDPYGSGYGRVSLTILDAQTGAPVATFDQERGGQIALVNTAWEDDDSVVATAQKGAAAQIVRFGTDGTLESAVAPERVISDIPFWLGRDRARF